MKRRVMRQPAAVRPHAQTNREAGQDRQLRWTGKEVTHSSPPPIYSAQGACGKPRVVPHNRRPQARTYENGRSEMQLLSTCGSRVDVEPTVELGELLDRVGVPLVPVGVWL
jgi:hypothetical protein